MKNSKLYILGIIFLVLIVGYFMFKNSDNQANGAVAAELSDKGVQTVSIGMKDFNYYPNTIKVKAEKPVKITLDKTVSGCFRDFTIRELGIRKYLMTPQETIEFTPSSPGTYVFSCSMGMGRGKLIVE